MLTTTFLDGQGLGNQLWCYAVTRTIALDRGLQFAVKGANHFKGRNFMSLDMGIYDNKSQGIYHERSTFQDGFDVSKFDPGMLTVPDGTELAGVMQAEQYIYHRKQEIANWFNVGSTPLDACLIHIRGGDFIHAGDTLLPHTYYYNAMEHMKSINPNIVFGIVTDDTPLAMRLCPGVSIAGNIGLRDDTQAGHHIGGNVGIDYRTLNGAKYLILSNSSFGWWAAWTNPNNPYVIAPKYWARFNRDVWSTGDILTHDWMWLDRYGKISTYQQCKDEQNA